MGKDFGKAKVFNETNFYFSFKDARKKPTGIMYNILDVSNLTLKKLPSK